MKYFTMEELDDITKELIDNPSRETLKNLNEKYNGEVHTDTKWVETSNSHGLLETLQEKQKDVESLTGISDMANTQQESVINNTNNTPTIEETRTIPKMEVPISNIPFWNPVNNTNSTLFDSNTNQNIETNNESIPSLSTPTLNKIEIQSEPLNNNNISVNEQPITTPSINTIPSLEIPKMESFTPNNNAVPFNGNIWEPQKNMVNSMMQTTDNFNKPIDQMPNNQMAVNQNPFFQANQSPVNKPIPVTEPPVMEGPTMFGQFEQDFNNNAA